MGYFDELAHNYSQFRNCLRCSKLFMSTDSSNRICKTCRNYEEQRAADGERLMPIPRVIQPEES